MTLDEVKQYFNENKNSEETKAYLQGLITVEGVQNFMETSDGKSWLDSVKDKHLQKGLETWKANNLQKEIDKKIAELYPEENEEKKQLRELNSKIEKMEQEKQREVLKNKALTVATEKKLPITNIVDLLLGKDEESTLENIGRLETVFGDSVKSAVEERLKSNSYIPPQSKEQEPKVRNLGDALKNYYTKNNN
ncbi:DUF4355 domain-containing protein [Caproiciproducens faecalis]|uniref:DUF4355 domain-containing protein n=1 Tax=Caproiciproducens faecalis TaxID=2820301 RepID=A0ABS7DNQ1_9FIRM|nr:DUF4355 domain-containing protein [Caproiciproducens faecalis]MBW7572435.1 DUF4355 domain-containing protein [Caproiciproducens faecalis]